MLGEVLISLGVSEGKVKEAIEKVNDSKKNGKVERLGEFLLKQNVIDERTLGRALSIQFGLKFLERLSLEEIDGEVMSKIPSHYAKSKKFVVLKGGVVATSEPQDITLICDLQRLLGEIEIAVSPQSEVDRLINDFYGEGARFSAEEAVEKAEEYFEENLEETTRDILEEKGDAPIIKFVNALFFQAVKEGASDIHIEPGEKETSIRIRLDGVLHEIMKISKKLNEPIVSRIKVMAKLDIAEKRIPQDGKIRLKVGGKDIDIRVSTIPTLYGERVVMRLLMRSETLLQLEEIGMEDDMRETIYKLIQKPYGMILLTGPTGSGKTTTLYACLSKINNTGINIITIEDPVEYQLKGINQIQVNPKVGLTFATGLRSILRQDPDVIMVGEIRDSETASISIHAALTGHLVLSTLHTNDAPSAVTRLVDMGIEPYLISSALLASVAQRLVRKICKNCAEKYKPSKTEIEELGIDTEYLWRGKGCKNCFGTGYKGRTGIFEIFLVDDDIRGHITKNPDASHLRKVAREKGMITLKQDGVRKVLKGITTPQEVLRVIQEF